MVTLAEQREDFIARMQREWPTDGRIPNMCRKLLRLAPKYQRLQVARCNGDYPADNGERDTRVCENPSCGCAWAHDSFQPDGDCPDCHQEKLIEKACETFPGQVTPVFQGDPRGCTIKLRVPSGNTDDLGREGICVPC